jgi:hypothetical protein
VTLTILPPCVLSSPAPASLTFSVPQGQSSSTTQNVTLSETGTCAHPVTWTANAGSSTWLVLSAASGSDSGSGSTLGVNVNPPANMAPGTYSGTITITATDSTGASSGQTISVSLTVTATISGSVIACADQTCTTSQPLPGATVTLMNGSTTIATVTADASGAFSFTGVVAGSYSISASGTDASNTHYIGSATLTVSGNTSLTIQAFPG